MGPDDCAAAEERGRAECDPRLATGGAEPDGNTLQSVTSQDGSCIAFRSEAANLLPGDTNFRFDIYLRDEGALAALTYCTGKASSAGCLTLIGTTGALPPMSGASNLSITATQVQDGKNGLLLVGITGAASRPSSEGRSA